MTREFVLPIRVYYEDTDAGGVVYHSNYINFMERARTEWLRDLGYEQDQLRDDMNIVFAVRSMEVDFLRPARFNELLSATAEVTEYGKASMVFSQNIKREQEVLCRARVKIACIDNEKFKPTALPEAILSELKHASSI